MQDAETRSGTLSSEELEKLSPWAVSALAARAALRAVPVYVPSAQMPEAQARAMMEAVCLAALWAQAAAQMGEPGDANDLAYHLSGLAEQYGDAGFHAVRAAAAALEAFHKEARLPHGGNALVETLRASGAALQDVADDAGESAFHQDYSVLQQMVPGSDIAPSMTKAAVQQQAPLSDSSRPVPPEFFERPLWDGHEDPQRQLEQPLSVWQARMNSLDLNDLANLYGAVHDGKGVPAYEVIRRVEAWRSDSFRPPEGARPEPRPAQSRPLLRMLADAPLESDDGDRLGFVDYAEALWGLMTNVVTRTPLTVAIHAPWGAGKSTLAKMVERRLLSRNADGGEYPHVTCWFNAWMHDDAPNLAAAFAAEVARAADRRRPFYRRLLSPLPASLSSPEDRRLTRKRLLLAAVFLAVAAWIAVQWQPGGGKTILDRLVTWLPFVGMKEEEVVKTAKVFGSFGGLLYGGFGIGKYLLSLGQSLTTFIKDPEAAAAEGAMPQVREQLGRLIHQATPKGSRFVIFVDDIERCRPPRNVELLEVVNQLLGHEGVVTVILGDMQTVAACAAMKYGEMAAHHAGGAEKSEGPEAYGRLYLQKIIQLQFDLPAHSPQQIRAMAQGLTEEVARDEEEPCAPEDGPLESVKERARRSWHEQDSGLGFIRDLVEDRTFRHPAARAFYIGFCSS